MSDKLREAIAKREADRQAKPKRARSSSKPSSSKPDAQGAPDQPADGTS